MYYVTGTQKKYFYMQIYDLELELDDDVTGNVFGPTSFRLNLRRFLMPLQQTSFENI